MTPFEISEIRCRARCGKSKSGEVVKLCNLVEALRADFEARKADFEAYITRYLEALQRCHDEAAMLAQNCEPAPHTCPRCEIMHVAYEALHPLPAGGEGWDKPSTGG